MRVKQAFRMTLLAAAMAGSAQAQWVEVDPGFPAGGGPDSYVTALALDREGRVLLSGQFTAVGGMPRPLLARLWPDGTLDESFAPVVNRRVGRLQPLADGRVLLTTGFTNVNGVFRPGLARLLADGSLDADFAPPALSDPLQSLTGTAAPDGTVYVTGAFTNLGGMPRTRLARLLPNGAVDAAFEAPFGPEDRVSVLAVQGDGRPLVSGAFTNLAGLPLTNLARLNLDGSVDPTYRPRLNPAWQLGQALLLSDERLLLVAQISTNVSGPGRTELLLRLQTDGSLDTAFDAGLGWPGALVEGTVRSLAVQPDGKILLGGLLYRVNGEPRAGIARLHADGTLDHCFEVPLSSELFVPTMAVDSQGGIVIGYFSRNLQGRPVPYLARLVAPPACDTGVIELGVPGLLAREDALRAIVPVARRGGADREQTVAFTTRAGTAESGTDFEATGGVVRFAPGQRSQFITVPLRFDQLAEGPETFEVVLTETGGGAVLGSQTRTLVTLSDAVPGTAGAPDTNFVVRLDGPVNLIQPLADGGAVIAGNFTNVNGALCPSVARLRADGSRDAGFARTQPLSPWLNGLAVDALGRVLVSGSFQTVDGVWRPGLVRFDPSGALDPAFAPFEDWPTNRFGQAVEVSALTLLADGDLVASISVPLDDGAPRRLLVKITPDGRLDEVFNARVPEGVTAVALRSLADGALLLGGAGLGAPLVRLRADGGLDLDFVPPVDLAQLSASSGLDVLPDGRAVFGGFTPLAPYADSPALRRLNPDGSDDAGFRLPDPFRPLGRLQQVQAVSVTPDGRALIAGRFAAGGDATFLLRLLADGSPDGSFDAGTGLQPTRSGDAASVFALAALPVGGWLLGGNFGSYDGFEQPFLVKLLPETPGRPREFRFTITNITLVEAGGPFVLEVHRTGDATEPASIRVRTEAGSATGGEDFEPLDTRLDFAPGEWSRTIALNILDDHLVEGPEQFTINLAEPTGGFALGTPASVTVQIQSDDAGVEFIDTRFLAREEDGYALAAVRWSGALDDETRAAVAVEPMTGSLDDLLVPTAVVPYDGSLSTPATNWFRLALADDAAREGRETFRLVLIGSERVTPGPQATATLVVEDRDYRASPARGVAGVVEAMAEAPNGGVYLAGDFTGVHGVPRARVARLRADGDVDFEFDPSSGPNGTVTVLAVQADGRLVIAGDFTAVAGVPRAGVARLHVDGSLDVSFDPGVGAQQADMTPFVRALLAQPDGTLWVGGVFTHFSGRLSRLIARLRSDGVVDPGFASPFVDPAPTWPRSFPAAGGAIYALAQRPDGRLLAAGRMYFAPPAGRVGPLPGQSPAAVGVFLDPSFTQASVVSLTPAGTIDPTFQPVASGLAWSLAVAPDGGVVVGGTARAVSPPPGTEQTNWLAIARFLEDGTPDAVFQVRNAPALTYTSAEVRQLLVQADGGIVFSAAVFPEARSGEAPEDFAIIGRLRADGVWDETFAPLVCELPLLAQTPGPFWFSGDRPALISPFVPQPLARPVPTANFAVQPDATLVLAGAFDSVNGEPRRRLARVDAGGTLRGRLKLSLAGGPPLRLRAPAEVEAPYVIETSTDLRTWLPWLENEQPWWPLDLPAPREDSARFFRARPLR